MIKSVWRWLTSSIRRQLIVGVTSVLVLVMSALIYDIVRSQKEFLVQRGRSRAIFQSGILANSALSMVLSNDSSSLNSLVAQFKRDEYVLYVMVTDTEGRVLAHSDLPVEGKYITDKLGVAALWASHEPRIAYQTGHRVEAQYPIMLNGRLVGWAWLARDLTEVYQQIQTVTRAGIVYLVVALVMGTLVSLLLANALTRPLKLLLDGTGRLAADKLDQPVPLTSRNEVGVVTKAFNDAMEKIRAQRAELDNARKVAEQANLAKSQFLANMSHEIRTPLGAILGFSNIIQDPKLAPAERRQFIEIINRNGQELSRLINDLLDLSKVEAGKMHFERVKVEVTELLFDVVETLRPKAQEKGLTLWFSSEPDVPKTVFTDPTRLRQILVNLIGNAIKFTQLGGVTVTLKMDPNASPPAPRLAFVVEDTGTGIDPLQQSNLFQRFSQADSSTTRRFGGTGLGLFLSRRLARELGGDVELVQSAPGKGSTFLLTVAANYQKDTVHKVNGDLDLVGFPAPIQENGKDMPLRGMRILAVEDSIDNQLLIQRLLNKRGADVDIAVNGAEGVEKALENNYSLVLMDIQMPVMDGYGATAKLRSEGYKKPIVALTAHALEEDRRRCLESGFDEHLTKPISPSALVETILSFRS